MMIAAAKVVLAEKKLNPDMDWVFRKSPKWKNDVYARSEFVRIFDSLAAFKNFAGVEMDVFTFANQQSIPALAAATKRSAASVLGDTSISDSPPPKRRYGNDSDTEARGSQETGGGDDWTMENYI